MDQSEEKYRTLFTSTLHPIALIDLETQRVIDANPATLALFGYSRDDLSRLQVSDLVTDMASARASMQRVRTEGRAHLGLRYHRRKDGTAFPVALELALLRLDGRDVMVCEMQDLTEQQRAQEALAANEERFRSLIELSSDWYFELDPDLRFTHVSAHRARRFSATRYLGCTFESLPGVAPDSTLLIRRYLAARVPFRDQELCIVNEHGETRYVRCAAMPLFDGAEQFAGYRGIAQDITRAKQAEAASERLARYDDLTGLRNRAALAAEVGQRIEAAGPFRLLLLDLDRFRIINDSLGHHVGDELLKRVAQRLSTELGDERTLFRVGGDEFVILLPIETTEAFVAQLLERATSETYQVEGMALNTSCSAGIADYPQDGADLRALLKNAEAAMYRAKRRSTGNDFLRYSGEMHTRAMERLSLESDLRRAVSNDELYVVYQPRIDTASGRAIGAEALLRWANPRGAIGPADFLPVAEETGLVHEIGRLVLWEACRRVKEWRINAGRDVFVSVNLSPQQLNRQLVPLLVEVLGSTGIKPAMLELEITETALIANLDETVQVLRAVQDVGVRVALDDFGTGYSSLTHLKRFPLTTLKLDVSFIRDLDSGAQAQAIVEAATRMAHVLQLRVVAEGVETPEQFAILRRLGCDECQGYYFSHPIDSRSFVRSFL